MKKQNQRAIIPFLLLYVCITCLCVSCNSSSGTRIDNLRVTALETPLGIDIKQPDFSWSMQSQTIGIKQTSYQLIVATDSKFSNVIWDSGLVDSNQSVGILYGSSGNAGQLTPETDYFWKVTIADNTGGMHNATSSFSTGLMNPSIAAWDGAQWIGSNDLSLDATSALLFHLSTKFQIVEGNKMSLIFGANDFRLNDKFQNVENIEGENYIRLELDVNGVGKAEGAVLNIYRVGYAKNDSPTTPFKTISRATEPNANINTLITPANAYAENTIDIDVNASNITIHINGQPLMLAPPTVRAGGGTGGFAGTGSGGPVSRASNITVSPFGRGGNNFNTFPNLNSIGFYAEQGEKVEFTDYALKNVGQGIEADLFSASAGATYSIFKDIQGVSIAGNKITVANQTLGYADPSYYGSLSMLRTQFSTENGKKIQQAKMYVTAMGAYEMYINGQKMTDDWFNPGMSQYRETLAYHTYDVTKLLKNGDNAIGAILGPGFYTGYVTFTPGNYNFFGDSEALLAKLVISYTDGSKKTIVSNTNDWKLYKEGPVEYASMFQGQRYNANKEEAIKDWNTTNYSATGWKAPEVIKQRDWIDFDLVARRDNPVHEIERLNAIRVLNTHSERQNTYTYDMSVAMVGVPSITIPAGSLKEGDVVILRYGEEFYPGNDDSPNTVMPSGVTYESLYGPSGTYRPGVAGRVLHDTYRAALATDFYTASKADETRAVVIEPHFTYRGYRYVQITIPNRTSALPLNNVQGIVLSSEEVTGKYEGTTTDETGTLVNQLFKNIQRSQLGNFFSIPTDCPQRNERMGWTGDAQAYSRTATYNGDVQSFFRQWMVALRNDQGIGGRDGAPAGGIGSTVPSYNKGRDVIFADGTTWAGAVCMVPWQLYTQYGDLEVVKENFETMKLWLDGMNHYEIPGYEGLSARTSGLADWLSIDSRTTSDICNNAIYMYMMEITAIMSDAIGETAYANTLRQRHAKAKESFNRAYIDPETGMTRSIALATGAIGTIIDSQASYATPMNFNCFSTDMTITSGANAGMSYYDYAAKRLGELAAKPSRSGNEGTSLVAARGGISFGGGPQGNAVNPTQNSLDNTITTGFSGTPNILPALTRTGNIETAYNMLSCTDYASWLYPVKLGSTSMWERWNSYELAFQMGGESSMNSFNHFALGSVGSWIHEYHLGITTDNAGYQDFVLQPQPGGSYTKASGTFESNYGTIYSSWTADKGKLTSYEFTVPANTSSTLYLPVSASAVEGFAAIEGIQYIGMETRNGIETAKFKAEAGSYRMAIENGMWKVAVRR